MVFKVRSSGPPAARPALTQLHTVQADIHTARIQGKPLQEVHRFLLTDATGQPIDDPVLRDRVVKQARAASLPGRPRLSRMFCDQVRGGLLG